VKLEKKRMFVVWNAATKGGDVSNPAIPTSGQ
jgi:hypothetical protein